MYQNYFEFPINEYLYYDTIDFESFNDAMYYFRDEINIKDFQLYFRNILKGDAAEVFNKIIQFFPFIFFSNHLFFDKNKLKKDIDSSEIVTDKEGLYDLFNFKIDLKEIHKALIIVKNQGDVNYKNFVCNIIQILYKYSFFKIIESLKLNKYDIKFSDKINDYYNCKENLALPNTNRQINLITSYIYYFEKSISDNNDDVFNKVITEFEIFKKNAHFAKLLYLIIESNIRFDKGVESVDINKLIRPIFHELICNINYPDFYQYGIDDKQLPSKQKDFVLQYHKLFSIKGYKN